MGKSERSAVATYITRIIQHLAKLDHSPAAEPRNGSRRTIRLARLKVERRVEENPSLRPEIGHIVGAEMRRGLEHAILDLEEDGEVDEVDANAVRRRTCTTEQILGDWFPPEPKG